MVQGDAGMMKPKSHLLQWLNWCMGQHLAVWLRGLSLVTGLWVQPVSPLILVRKAAPPLCVSWFCQIFSHPKAIEDATRADIIHLAVAAAPKVVAPVFRLDFMSSYKYFTPFRFARQVVEIHQ